MKHTKTENKHVYQLELTERQAELLNYACDRLSRIICGQDWTYQEFMEEAWEKRCKEATGEIMDKEWDGGWYAMRADAEAWCKQIKKRFWNLESNALYGIHYDDVADILFSLHTVIRHQLWKDRPGEKSRMTVDSDEPTKVGSEPLATIRRTDVSYDELMKEMENLYASIENCIIDLVHGRAEKNDSLVANAQHRMESLMVRTQQELIVIADYLTKKV